MSLKQLLVTTLLLLVSLHLLHSKYYSLAPGYIFNYDQTTGIETLFFRYQIHVPAATFVEFSVQDAVMDYNTNTVYMVMQDQYRGVTALVSFNFDTKQLKQTPAEQLIKNSLFVNLYWDDSDKRLFATVIEKKYPDQPREWIVEVDKEQLLISTYLSNVSQSNRYMHRGVYMPGNKELYLQVSGPDADRILIINMAAIKEHTPLDDILVSSLLNVRRARGLIRNEGQIYGIVDERIFDPVMFGSLQFNETHATFNEMAKLSPQGFTHLGDFPPCAIDFKANQLAYLLDDFGNTFYAGTVNLDTQKKDFSAEIPGFLGHRLIYIPDKQASMSLKKL